MLLFEMLYIAVFFFFFNVFSNVLGGRGGQGGRHLGLVSESHRKDGAEELQLSTVFLQNPPAKWNHVKQNNYY